MTARFLRFAKACVAIPLLMGSASAWAQQPPQPVPPPAQAKSADGAPAVNSSNLTSLFYNATEREAIATARKQFLERDTQTESEADLLDQLQGIKEGAAQKPKEDLQEKFYPQFYLETLIYHTPSDWTVWLKDGDASKKYTPDLAVPAEAPLKIIAINKEDISFTWKPRGWTAVSNAYKEGTPGINIDKEKQIVVFTLRVNQLLFAKDMQIKEGYTPPLATDPGKDPKALDPKAKAAAAAAAAKAQPGKPPLPVPPKGGPPGQSGQTVLDLYKTLEPADKKKP